MFLIEKNSCHVNVSRSMSSMINGQPLGPEEHSHLLGCEDCMNSAVDAVLEEMERRSPIRPENPLKTAISSFHPEVAVPIR
jgi:hypothetical protein